MSKKSKKTIENEILTHVIDLGEKGKESRKKYLNRIRTYNKRYEAQRSVLGDSYGNEVISEPWIGASDFGFPLEAITIDNLVTREFQAKWGTRPSVRLKALEEEGKDLKDDAEAYLDYKLHHKIPNFVLHKKMADRIKSIEGGYISKIINTEYKFWETSADQNFLIKNKVTGEYSTGEDGEPLIDDGSQEISPDFEREEIKAKEEKTYFSGTKYIVKHYKDIIVPEDAIQRQNYVK
jgi:hypothetical protein